LTLVDHRRRGLASEGGREGIESEKEREGKARSWELTRGESMSRALGGGDWQGRGDILKGGAETVGQTAFGHMSLTTGHRDVTKSEIPQKGRS